MKRLQILALIALVLLETACPNEPSKNLKDAPLVKNINTALNDYLKQTEYACYCYSIKKKPLSSMDATDPLKCDTDDNDGPNKAKTIRNDALDRVMGMADDNYQAFITAIETRRSRTEFVADVIDLGMGASTGIIKGKQRTIQILGIALTAFRGIRKSEDLNFYKQQTTPILIAKMDDNRAKVESRIVQQKEKPIEKYSMPAAVRDMVAYYNAGTLVRAFTELAKDTSVQAQQSEKRVLHLKNIDETQIVNIPEDATSAINVISSLRNQFIDILNGTDQTLKDNASDQLRKIYLDVATGDKKDAFKPVLDELRKNATFKGQMDDLESGVPARVNGVKEVPLFTLVSNILFKINALGKTELFVPLKDIFVKHTS